MLSYYKSNVHGQVSVFSRTWILHETLKDNEFGKYQNINAYKYPFCFSISQEMIDEFQQEYIYNIQVSNQLAQIPGSTTGYKCIIINLSSPPIFSERAFKS